jgi:ribonuclease HII
VISVIGGDGKSLSIAAASVVAKVARDRVMRKLHKLYPNYNFLHNKGYGTKQHLEAILEHGTLPIHRRTYLKAVEKRPTLF